MYSPPKDVTVDINIIQFSIAELGRGLINAQP